MSKTPLVTPLFHRVYALPLQQASVPLRHHTKAGICTSTYCVFQLDRRTVDVPSLPTTTPAAALAKKRLLPANYPLPALPPGRQSPCARTGNVIHFLRLGWHMQRRLPGCSSDIPCSERVTNRAESCNRQSVSCRAQQSLLRSYIYDNSFKFREIRR